MKATSMVFAGMGGGLLAAMNSAHGNEKVILGVLAMGFFGYRLVSGLVATQGTKPDGNPRKDAPRIDPDDPRLAPPTHEKQAAGALCVACEKKIVVAFEAESCGACESFAHASCLERHVAAAHGPAAAAYR